VLLRPWNIPVTDDPKPPPPPAPRICVPRELLQKMILPMRKTVPMLVRKSVPGGFAASDVAFV